MKSRIGVLLGVVLLLCISGWAGYTNAQKAATSDQKWEYLVFIPMPLAPLQDQLNRLGAQGWELVCVQVGTTGPVVIEPAQSQSTVYRERGTEGTAFYFKRPK